MTKPKTPKKKATTGRPKEYTQEWVDNHVEQIPDMFKDGQSIIEVVVELGMCKDTFYRLKEEFPEFSDAVKEGVMKSEAWWAKLGRQGSSTEQDIQPTTWIFNMKNRFDWKDKTESSDTVTHKFSDVTDDELKARLQSLMPK